MKRAIIYGRKSTNKQKEESIETQIYECQKWARENNCTVIEIYDDSESGRAYNVGNRDGFQQIKHDAKMGKMDYALIHKIDRFARSVADYFIEERELEKYGVKIIVVGMPFFQNADIITKSVHIAMAEQFSTNLSNEVSTKMRTFARKGAFLGGKAPYGFNVVGDGSSKTFEINFEEAQGVRLVYQKYLEGYGYIQISKQIAKQGYLNAKGEPFTPTHISKMLKSKKYNGWYIFGNREIVNGKSVKVTDPEKLIEIPDVYPKIIDDETFAAVQNKMQSKAPKNKRRPRHYPFTGVMTCGCCGRAVVGCSTVHLQRKTKQYNYYRCNGYKVNECKVPSIRADHLEEYVADKIKSHVFDDAFTASLIAEVQQHLSGDVENFTKLKRDIEKELSSVKESLKNALRDKYNRTIDEDIYEEVVSELSDQRSVLELRLSNINQQLAVNDKTDEIKKYVKWLRNNLENADEHVRNALLQQIVHSIIVTQDKIEIYVHMTTPPTNGKRHYLSLSNMVRGVPLFMLNKQNKVFTENGLSLITFEINGIAAFNQQ